MGNFSWADMALGMLDANIYIYINNDLLLRSVMMVMVEWLLVGRTSLGQARARLSRALS